MSDRRDDDDRYTEHLESVAEDRARLPLLGPIEAEHEARAAGDAYERWFWGRS